VSSLQSNKRHSVSCAIKRVQTYSQNVHQYSNTYIPINDRKSNILSALQLQWLVLYQVLFGIWQIYLSYTFRLVNSHFQDNSRHFVP
jgi:hypothetical protein